MHRLFSSAAFSVALLAFFVPSSSWGFLNFFEDDYENAPNDAEFREQEAAAKAMLAEAQSLEGAGNSGKAVNVYRKIVQSYPLTTTAALSQYKVGVIYRAQEDYLKAFDAFQSFVENYKNSSAFASAVQAQFEITSAGQKGEFKDSFLGIPRKLQPSELLEMYGKVISNAPYSEYAPLAQFQIAEVYQNDGKGTEAIAAYQKLVDDYPKSSKAPEAQYRIGAIGVNALERGSQDPGKVAKAKEAYEDLLIQFPDDERARAAREGISKLTEGDAKKSFEVGSFYEKQKLYHSARIYFEKVLQVPSSPYYAQAQEKLASMPDTGPVSTETIHEPDAASGGLREFKFPSMPKLPKLFGKKGDDEDLDTYADGGSGLFAEDVDDVNWAELDREMQDNLGNSRELPAESEVAPEAAAVADEKKGGFGLPNIAFWKKDATEETGGTVPEVADESSRSGLGRLAFWKKDESQQPAPADADDFAPVETERRKTIASRPSDAPAVKATEDAEKKRFIRIPKLPGFGKDKEAEPSADVASSPSNEKKLKNQPSYVGPPAPKPKPQTASVPMRINAAGQPLPVDGDAIAESEVSGGKPSEEAKKRLVVTPLPED